MLISNPNNKSVQKFKKKKTKQYRAIKKRKEDNSYKKRKFPRNNKSDGKPVGLSKQFYVSELQNSMDY